MKVSIHQSQYLPWAPYFKKIARSEVFIIMDDVQFQKNGIQNRNQIRDYNAAHWLTVPVTGNLEDKISEKKIAQPNWSAKHWKSITMMYSRAPQWKNLQNPLSEIYERSYSVLSEANQPFIDFVIRYLGIETQILKMSKMNANGKASELVLNLCQSAKASVYISGRGSESYLDSAAFRDAQIEIRYLESIPPQYSQFQGGEFISGLSILDMMMNLDQNKMRNYLYE